MTQDHIVEDLAIKAADDAVDAVSRTLSLIDDRHAQLLISVRATMALMVVATAHFASGPDDDDGDVNSDDVEPAHLWFICVLMGVLFEDAAMLDEAASSPRGLNRALAAAAKESVELTILRGRRSERFQKQDEDYLRGVLSEFQKKLALV